jgi:hypothetical protein
MLAQIHAINLYDHHSEIESKESFLTMFKAVENFLAQKRLLVKKGLG